MTPRARTLNIFEKADPLPIDMVTDSTAILARKRAGKSYTAGVIVERVIAAKIPVVILDPKGDWWGLKYTADDSGPGLPITIFGGEHEDYPIERDEGEVMANVVVDFPGYYLFDFSMWAKAARIQFVSAFVEHLWVRKAPRKQHWPMLIVIDEADQFVPQRVGPEMANMVGAFEVLVRQGGVRGLGSMIISQRPAVVNKNVLTQAAIFMALQITGPQDRDAALAWFEGRATKEQLEDARSSLASLGKGEVYMYAPELDVLGRRQVRQKWTFDSGRTPKVGERLIVPKKVAKVDLDRLREMRSAALEKKKQTNPKELAKRIAVLERELRAAASAPPKTEKVADPALVRTIQRLKKALEAAMKFIVQVNLQEFPATLDTGDRAALEKAIEAAVAAAAKDIDRKLDKRQGDFARLKREGERILKQLTELAGDDVTVDVSIRPQEPYAVETPAATTRQQRPRVPAPELNGSLPKGEHIVLTAIAQHHGGCTREQVTILTGYKRSTRDAYIQRLRTRELARVRGPEVYASDVLFEEGG